MKNYFKHKLLIISHFPETAEEEPSIILISWPEFNSYEKYRRELVVILSLGPESTIQEELFKV